MHRILHPVAKLCLALLCVVLSMSTITAAAQKQTNKDKNWSYPTSKPANPFDGGDGTEKNPYRIRTAQQLANLAYMVNKGEEYKGKYFLMTEDIVLNEGVMNDDGTYNAAAASSAKKWTTIGSPGSFDYDYFKGFFDGGGHTVYGFYQNYPNAESDKYHPRGFFGCVSNAIISNLTISHSYLYSMGQGWKYGPGFFCGEAEGTTFSNVHVKKSYFYENVYDPREKFIGGIVGLGNGVEIKDCSFDGTIDVYAKSAQSTLNVGGIAGILSAQASKVTGCKTSGRMKVTQYDDDESTFALGGLIGLLRAGLTLNRCLNMMDIEVHHDNPEDVCCNLYAGGIGGLLEMKSYDLDINHCVNLGNISVGGDGEKLDMDNHSLMLSGIANVESKIGMLCSQTLNVSDCANYGNFDVDALTFESDDADENLLVAGCCALFTKPIGNLYSNWTRCISVGDSHDLNAGGIDIRYAPIMGFLDRPKDAKDYIKDVSGCYYYTNITKNRLDVDSRLNGTSLNRFDNQTPFTTNRNNPWTLLTATESKTWAGYAVPYTPFFTMTKLSGSGTETDPFLITNEKELLMLNTIMANTTGYGRYFRLENDLDMTNMGTFPTIVNGNTGFIGTFDGNGRYINGLRVSGHAMFDKLSGTVKNLTLTNFRGNEMANHNTSIASSLYGTIENCAVYGTISACGRDIYDEKVEVSGIAGLVSNDGSTFVGHIKNCVFKGTFKVSPLLNGKTVGNVTKRLRYDGICNYLNCDKGSGSSVTGCYASYTVEGADDTGFTNVDRTAGVGDNINSYGVMENNYFVCPQTPEAYIKNDGVFRAKSEAEITPDMLGDTKGTVWRQGAFRPVNKHTKHLIVTDHNDQTTYLDLCPDDAWTPNKVYTATMTQDNAEDRLLQQFKNLALYNPQSHTAYIINLELDRALSSFDYKPLEGTATKGATRITLKKDDALAGAPGHYLLCLPCPLRTADLPAGSEIHGLGYFAKNEDKTGESVFYLTECDSVGAGVPCHVYIPDCVSGDFTLLSYGDIVAAPQGTAENGPQGYFKAQNVRDAFTGITLNVTTPHSLTYAASTDVKIFGAAATSTSKTTTQLLSIIRVLDESDPYLHETIHALNGVSKANLYVKRTLVADEWNTLTLPFTIEANTLAFHCGEGNTLQVQKLANVTTEDGGLVLYFEDASTLEAGKPYLVKPTATCTSINLFNEPCTLNQVLTSVSAHDVQDLYEVTMLPNYAPLVLVEGDYFLQDDKFYVVAEGMTVKSKGMRAHFTANAAASAALQSARLVHADGDVTGIDGITRPAATNAVYDLSGRRVEKPAHGLYIVNGRKVLLP